MLPVTGEGNVFWVGNSFFSLRNKCCFPESQDKSMQNIIPINVATINISSNRTCIKLICSVFGEQEDSFCICMRRDYFFYHGNFSPKNLYLEEVPNGTNPLYKIESTNAFHSDSRYISRLDHNKSFSYNLILR